MDLQQHLNSLSDASSNLLRYAVVIGQKLQLNVLQQILPYISITDCIAECVDASILESKDNKYQFASSELRLKLLELTPKSQISETHHTIAEALESIYGTSSDTPVAKALAHHWRQAGDSKKEERYVTFAGEQALKNSDCDEAIKYFNRASGLVNHLDLSAEKKKRKYIHLHQRAGEAYLGLAEYDNAREVFQSSLELCESLNHDISIAVALGHLGNAELAAGNHLEAKNIYERALKIYREQGNEAGIERTRNQLSKINEK